MFLGSIQRLSTFTEYLSLVFNDFQVSQVTTAKSLGVAIETFKIGVATSKK